MSLVDKSDFMKKSHERARYIKSFDHSGRLSYRKCLSHAMKMTYEREKTMTFKKVSFMRKLLNYFYK